MRVQTKVRPLPNLWETTAWLEVVWPYTPSTPAGSGSQRALFSQNTPNLLLSRMRRSHMIQYCNNSLAYRSILVHCAPK